MLGKRKRKAEGVPQTLPKGSGGSSSNCEDVQETFRRHFEARFRPLDSVKSKTQEISTPTLDTDSGSEWEGFSEPEGEALLHAPCRREVEVVECTSPQSSLHEIPKEELNSFMTSRPPSSSARTAQSRRPKPDDDSAGTTDAANLRNDLALQRLLAESHLLDPQSSYSPMGANRHKANDLRLQSLGSKSSILTQVKMPMSHRKGITAKAAEREERRRKEARENGIILEKAKKTKRSNPARRERSIGGPGVGMFKKGMLRLNKRDVAEIEGPKRLNGKTRKGFRH